MITLSINNNYEFINYRSIQLEYRTLYLRILDQVLTILYNLVGLLHIALFFEYK